MHSRVLIAKNWLFELNGACSLLVLTWRHQLETLFIVLHENQPMRRHFASGLPKALLSLSQEKSSGVEIAVIVKYQFHCRIQGQRFFFHFNPLPAQSKPCQQRQAAVNVWIRDYPELLICFEFTIIVNLEDWNLDMDYGKWSYLFEKITQVYGHWNRT